MVVRRLAVGLSLLISASAFADGNASGINLSAVAAFDHGHCVATAIDLGGDDSAPAYILTNGHCWAYMVTRDSAHNLPDKRSVDFKNKTFAIEELEYATQQGSDLSIFRLKATMRDLRLAGVRPATIAPEGGVVGEKIMRAQNPQEVYTCEIEGIVPHLREGTHHGDRSWNYKDVYRHHCRSAPGSSGSPLISLESGKIIGIHSTGRPEKKDCSFDNPCEINDEDGSKQAIPGMNYGVRVQAVLTCVTPQGVFDLKTQGCQLKTED